MLTKQLLMYNDVYSDIVNNFFKDDKLRIKEELQDRSDPMTYGDEEIEADEPGRNICKRAEDVMFRIVLYSDNKDAEACDVFRLDQYERMEYVTQFEEGMDEKGRIPTGYKILPIITIALYLDYRQPWALPKTPHEAFGDKLDEKLKPIVDNYKMNLMEPAFMSDDQSAGFKSDFGILVDYLVQMRKNGRYVPFAKHIRHVKEFLAAMTEISGDNRFNGVANKFAERDDADMRQVMNTVDQM